MVCFRFLFSRSCFDLFIRSAFQEMSVYANHAIILQRLCSSLLEHDLARPVGVVQDEALALFVMV